MNAPNILLLFLSFQVLGISCSGQVSERSELSKSFISEDEKTKSGVFVNNVEIKACTLDSLLNTCAIQIEKGQYWYDKINGSWGYDGGPTVGFILPYLELGGTLSADASRGDTEVFVNGRELHKTDVDYLSSIIRVSAGRYWLDHLGNGGYEGEAATFNLLDLSRRSNNMFRRNSYTGIGAGSDGNTTYIMGSDWSVIVGE